MANYIQTTLSLFSGVGGLDIGWELATGARVLGYCERDAYAAATLLARMESAALEPAPIWCGDITELPLAPFRGVDAIIGGFPCQDISVAGKQAGILEGNRSSLWRTGFVRAIRELRPKYVFVENVGALLVRGIDIVLGDLAALGYDAQWSSIRASEVGAPHRRERAFILGHAAGERREGRGGGWIPGAEFGTGSQQVAHASSTAIRRHAGAAPGTQGEDEGRRSHDGDRAQCGGADVANAENRAWPPGPEDADAWQDILAERPWLAPAVKPGVCVLADGVAVAVDESRADQLRCAGNGVVPLQAAVAARELMRRLGQ